MGKKNKKTTSAPGEKRQKTAAKQKETVSAVEPAVSNGTHKPKYALMGSAGKQSTSTVARVFSTLEYGPAPESPAAANAWLDSHGRDFGHFIDNEWYKPSGGNWGLGLFCTYAPEMSVGISPITLRSVSVRSSSTGAYTS